MSGPAAGTGDLSQGLGVVPVPSPGDSKVYTYLPMKRICIRTGCLFARVVSSSVPSSCRGSNAPETTTAGTT